VLSLDQYRVAFFCFKTLPTFIKCKKDFSLYFFLISLFTFSQGKDSLYFKNGIENPSLLKTHHFGIFSARINQNFKLKKLRIKPPYFSVQKAEIHFILLLKCTYQKIHQLEKFLATKPGTTDNLLLLIKIQLLQSTLILLSIQSSEGFDYKYLYRLPKSMNSELHFALI